MCALDYGAGYGMFVRMMRDYGFNFYWYDKYCENLFAKTFESKYEHYDILTAFELFEHLSNPYADIDKIVKLSDSIIFSTELVPDDVPDVKDWWYYSPETGQHISFYTKKSLNIIGKKYGLNYVGTNSLHAFTKKKINSYKWRICLKLSGLINKIFKRRSLLQQDYEKMRRIFL